MQIESWNNVIFPGVVTKWRLSFNTALITHHNNYLNTRHLFVEYTCCPVKKKP